MCAGQLKYKSILDRGSRTGNGKTYTHMLTNMSTVSVFQCLLPQLGPVAPISSARPNWFHTLRRVLNVCLSGHGPHSHGATRGPDSEPIEYRSSLTCWDDA